MADIVKIGRRGEIVRPRRARAALGLREGDELVVDCDDDSITVRRKARRFAEYLDTLGRAPAERPRH